jgi:hypothetical protein
VEEEEGLGRTTRLLSGRGRAESTGEERVVGGSNEAETTVARERVGPAATALVERASEFLTAANI